MGVASSCSLASDYDQKVTLPFVLNFKSMYYRWLPCLILSHDFLNYEFSKRLTAITQFKNGLVQKRELGRGRTKETHLLH